MTGWGWVLLGFCVSVTVVLTAALLREWGNDRRLMVRLRAADLSGAGREREAWRNCGHVAWGTCSTCYASLVLELQHDIGFMEASITLLPTTPGTVGDALQERVERLREIVREFKP